MKWYLILTLLNSGEVEIATFSNQNVCEKAANKWQISLLDKGMSKKDFSAICVKRI